MPRFPAALLFSTVLVLAACGKGETKREQQPPLVSAAVATPHVFVDRIDAVGTARAREQVTLAAPVTERIVRLNFEDGGYVAKGQVIAVLAQGQEGAQLTGAQAQAREASQQLARLQALKKRGFVTNASVDTQMAAATSARAVAEQAKASIADRVIRAPFSGWVSLRMISAGAVVTSGTTIATISDVTSIKLDFTVPETMLSSIAPGQPIDARAAAYPDESFRGTIATIDPVIDPNTRAVMVRALLPNPGRRLKPGMLLNVAIESRSRQGLAVPELSVIGEGEERYVFVVGKDGKAVRAPVKTGIRDGALIEIVQGLKPGQRVVGEGVVKVSDGMTVRVAGPRGKGS